MNPYIQFKLTINQELESCFDIVLPGWKRSDLKGNCIYKESPTGRFVMYEYKGKPLLQVDYVQRRFKRFV